MTYGEDVFTLHLEACGKLEILVERAKHPDSPGGREVTDEEWEGVRDHVHAAIQPGAVKLVLVEQVRSNIKHQGLEYVVSAGLPVEKNLMYSVRRSLGLVGPRGGPRTRRQKAPASWNLAKGLKEGQQGG